MRAIFFHLLFTAVIAIHAQPTISFTFDDGSTSDRTGYEFESWNGMLLDKLKAADVKAVFFVKGDGLRGERGQYLLQSWNDGGHQIANHTHSHPNFNRASNSAQVFEKELLKNDSLIRANSNYVKLFRFPYLKEGDTPEKVDSIRQIMAKHGYGNGHVTIDASDWYIDSRLRKRLKENAEADISGFRVYYLQHLFDRAQYYEGLSYELNNRHIKHTLLLHHNLAAALFLDDLISMFKAKGWQVISASEAFKDPIFREVSAHAGESLIWALAKDAGKFEDQLRYPAEDSRYEKDKMDVEGL